MHQIEYTAFHIDFSTLDIEKGQVNIAPSSFTIVVQPQERPGRITLPPEDEEKIPSNDKSVSPAPTLALPSSKKNAKSRKGS